MKHHNELKGKAFLFLSFFWYLWFINFTVRAIFSPILPLIEDEFAINHARATSIFIFQSVGYSISVLLSGFYSSRFGYKKTILCSLLMASAIFISIFFVKNLQLFYVFTFVFGFATGLYLPSAISLITEYFIEKDWGKSISIHDTAAPISIFCTPFIALFLLHFFKWRGIFGIFAAVFLVGAIIFYFVSDEVKISHVASKASLIDLFRRKSLWVIGVTVIFCAGANMGIYFITPLYFTKELSLSMDYTNTLLGISRFGSIGVAVVCGFLADRINLRKILFSMLFISGILTILLGVTPIRFVGAVLFLQALFVTGIFPLTFVLIAKIFSREMRSMATSLTMIASSICGGGLIPYLLGLSGDLISFRFGISVLGVLVILTSLLLLKKLE